MRWTIPVVLIVVAASAHFEGQEPPADRFYQSIRNDDLATLRALVKTHGTRVADRLGQTPLILAAAFGSADAVQLLVESGFPHGHDQWISQAGTAWAVMDLSVAAPEQLRAADSR